MRYYNNLEKVLEMRIIRLFLFCVACLSSLSLSAQQSNIYINGRARGAENHKVMLFRYADELSRCELLGDSATIDEDGRFDLAFYANYPEMVVLQIDDYSQSFYVEPGRTYHTRVENFDWCIDERVNVHIAPVVLPLRFDSLPPNELNFGISWFDRYCDSFVVANRIHFDARFRPERRYFDSLRGGVERHLKESGLSLQGDTYLERYCRYGLAEMEWRLGMTSRGRLYARYIRDNQILYYDANYMRFFLTLFTNSVSQGTRKISKDRLVAWVEGGMLDTYLDSLGLDPLLRNEQVRELVALQALGEMYYDRRYFRPEAVGQMVLKMARKSRFENHRKLARQLLETFREQHQEQPHYELTDQDRKAVSLDTLMAPWVYLAFVRLDDPVSVGELQTMAHFRDTIEKTCGDSVRFVTIVCDRELQRMYHFLNNRKDSRIYDWTFLHFSNNWQLLEQMEVVSYPTFVLIHGDEVNLDMPKPSTGYLLSAPWWPKREQAETRRLVGE